MKLSDLKVGEEGIILKVKCRGAIKHRLIEMGMLPGIKVRVMHIAPLGDPIEYHLRGYCLSIRKEDAKDILIKSFSYKNLIPLSMLSEGKKAKVVTLELDHPNRELFDSYGIKHDSIIKVLNISKGLITLKFGRKRISFDKNICAKIHVRQVR